MGTRLDLVMIGPDDKKADRVINMVKNLVEDIENFLSIHRPGSELSNLNLEAFKREVVVSEDLFNLLKQCKYYYEFTGHWFDVSLAKLTRAWMGDTTPDREVIDRLVSNTGYDKVEIDEGKMSVRYLTEDIGIDPGGFGKGVAVGRIRDLLLLEGISNSLLSFGESSVAGIGKHPHGPCWPVAVSGILNKALRLTTIELTDSFMSASGTGFKSGDGMFAPGNNIIDPFTGYPVDQPKTVTVVSDDPVVAEVLSTSLLINRNCIDKKTLSENCHRVVEVSCDGDRNETIVEILS